MKLERFKASGINGYLDFDIGFYSGLTFLTGINGTGKTSALNAISSLLMPRLDYLATQQFDEISITIEENGESVRLIAEKLGDETCLKCSKFPDEEVSFSAYDDPLDYRSFQAEEMEERYYKELLDDNSNTQIVAFILDLPTPMFLGLDRRSRSLDADARYLRRASPRTTKKRRRNIFGTSLGGSLTEAQSYAENTMFDCYRRKGVLDRKFRNNLIFELLNFPLNEFSGFMSDDDIISKQKLATAKRNVYQIPKLLDLDSDKVTERLSELFEFIEDKIILANQPPKEINEDEPWNNPAFRARLALAENRSSIEKINALSGLVTEYTRNVDAIFSKIKEFSQTVNSFIQDSSKTLEFDDRGHLSFHVGDEVAERDLRTLSSGEIQLIVIFAHLYFNPETERANIFIIDEPELSLHVQWQARFVDAILKASENTQFVMATHSPTVIMSRVDNCIEIESKS